MRIGEILGLTWDCVYIENSLVRAGEAYLSVEKELQRSSNQSIEELTQHGRNNIFFTFLLKQSTYTTSLVLKVPKTESSVRSIYIPEYAGSTEPTGHIHHLGKPQMLLYTPDVDDVRSAGANQTPFL